MIRYEASIPRAACGRFRTPRGVLALVGRDDSPIVRTSSGAEPVSRSVLIAF